MTATIVADNGAGSSSPVTVLSPWATGWQSRSIVHDLIGGGIAVSMVAPRPRAGSMELLYQTEDAAFAAVALHLEETTLTLTEDDREHVSMTYVVVGSVQVRLDEGTLNMWVVTVDYQEVVP